MFSLETESEFLWWLLGLALLALFFLLLKIWRRRKKSERLERDRCGLWRYHKETQFRRIAAYGNRLEEEDDEDQSLEAEEAETKKSGKAAKVLAVVDFQGDLRAKQHSTLASLVDEIECNARKICEVVVCINSPGGMVSQYGHAFSEMERIRALGISLTVCIDVVAASGGYLMALPANKIIAAPFAIVGSVGVMAFVPNFRQFLLERNINPRTYTAGKYKRTVGLTDEAGPEEEARFRSQLERVQRDFLAIVTKYRPKAKMEEVETGDHWSAQESIDEGLGLIDELGTSNQYLFRRNKEVDLVHLSYKKSRFEDGFGIFASVLGEQLETRFRRFFPS